MAHEPLRVLVVEDNDDDVLMIREGFGSTGLARVEHVAAHGEAALSWLRGLPPPGSGNQPDLVLVDLNMPRMNGFELIAALKADVGTRQLPVVVFTTSRRHEDVARAYAVGASTYVEKPVGPQALSDVLTLLAEYWTSVARLPSQLPTGDSDHGVR